jgi:RimJ/RimL family protein N-acetyltransferase
VTVEIQRFDTAAELRDVAGPFLMRNEAHHNLILGLIDRLSGSPRFYDAQPYFAAATAEGETVAAALMTPPFPLVLSLCEAADAFEPLAADARAFLPEVSGVNSPNALPFAEAWQRLTGESWEVALSERCYKLERLRAPAAVPGSVRRAGEADVELLTTWVMEFVREAVPWKEGPRDVTEARLRRFLGMPPELGGYLFWEVDGWPVCVAGYGNPTPNSMRIGPVYTPPVHRRQGYASACTAAACVDVLDSGKAFVTLFADLANATSNHVYQAIGFEPVCDAEVIRFGGR